MRYHREIIHILIRNDISSRSLKLTDSAEKIPLLVMLCTFCFFMHSLCRKVRCFGRLILWSKVLCHTVETWPSVFLIIGVIGAYVKWNSLQLRILLTFPVCLMNKVILSSWVLHDYSLFTPRVFVKSDFCLHIPFHLFLQYSSLAHHLASASLSLAFNWLLTELAYLLLGLFLPLENLTILL